MATVHRQSLVALGLVIALGSVSLADTAADPLFDDLDSELASTPTGFPDPLEELNRVTLRFNRVLDRFLLNPVTRVYRKLFPGPIKTSIRAAFMNVALVPALANHVLQGEAVNAAVTLGRLAVNSTIGLAGLLDPATEIGLDDRHADFGQTLAKLGVGSGPYLVIPVLGPTTVRDGAGGAVDVVIHPTTFFFGPFQRLTFTGGSGLSLRDANYEALKALDESSVDYYAALRNGFYQARMAEIWNGEAPPPPRRRVCRSMAVRIQRQPWRRPPQCSEACSLGSPDANLATCDSKF